ncbi:MAG: methionine adenosyltransferase [Bacilli bacterium]|jgi:S-adenosylmethionine synthetase|nr:methionine adenosyltransferase [Bacilli bacterium]NLN80374.1 methionine adenosyltransferase [Erysipelotrichia bacterium]
MKEKILFTSEAVSEGHPDKICDQISDAILDACLKQDEDSRVACEVFVTKDYLLIGGEITSNAIVNYEEVARRVLKDIGYVNESLGLDANTCQIDVRVNRQSPDIARGVNKNGVLENYGAGDQGMMFGYATIESEGYMPLPISIAQKLVRVASNLRKEGNFKWAKPDMKSQVTIDYTNPHQIRIDKIIMSVHHDKDFNKEQFEKYIHEEIMIPVAKSFNLNLDFDVLINSAGLFVVGGPESDTGLTGRKIIVDTYGGSAKHGGGAFSGKDATKVDRSGAYMARYVAKNLVAAGISQRLEVQISYAIGKSEPVSINVATFRTAKYNDDFILSIIKKFFDLRPGKIIENFSLHKPTFSYEKLAVYGHFGRPDINLPWEKLDQVVKIQKIIEEANLEEIRRIYK